MLSPLVRRRKGFRTPHPVKNAGVGRNTDPAARTSPPGCTAWKARRFGSPRTPWQAHRRACTIRRCRGEGCSARRSEPPAPRTVPQSGTESIPQGSWTRRNPPVKRLRPCVRRSLLVAPVHQPKIVDDIATAENEDPLVAKWGQASAHLHPLFRCKRHVETDLDNRDKRQGIHLVQDGPGTVVQAAFHRASHLCLPGRHPGECVRVSGVELETEIYGAANSAVNVIVSPARPSCEPTGATLSSLLSGGPPRVTVKV